MVPLSRYRQNYTRVRSATCAGASNQPWTISKNGGNVWLCIARFPTSNSRAQAARPLCRVGRDFVAPFASGRHNGTKNLDETTNDQRSMINYQPTNSVTDWFPNPRRIIAALVRGAGYQSTQPHGFEISLRLLDYCFKLPANWGAIVDLNPIGSVGMRVQKRENRRVPPILLTTLLQVPLKYGRPEGGTGLGCFLPGTWCGCAFTPEINDTARGTRREGPGRTLMGHEGEVISSTRVSQRKNEGLSQQTGWTLTPIWGYQLGLLTRPWRIPIGRGI